MLDAAEIHDVSDHLASAMTLLSQLRFHTQHCQPLLKIAGLLTEAQQLVASLSVSSVHARPTHMSSDDSQREDSVDGSSNQ